jgi:hypothetical protein
MATVNARALMSSAQTNTIATESAFICAICGLFHLRNLRGLSTRAARAWQAAASP